MSLSKPSAGNPGDEAGLPSEGVRTAITFGLIVFLSLLVVGWLTSSSMGTSPMCERLHDTLLQPLNAALLTERYEFNGFNDARFQVGAVVRAIPSKKGVPLPEKFYPLPESMSDRHQQYLQQLINGAANFATVREDGLADRLMASVSREILRDTGADEVKVRCYLPANEYDTAENLFRQTPEERVSDKNIREDGLANYETLFSATVYRPFADQEAKYSRDAGTALSAPAARPGAGPRPSGSSSSGELQIKPPAKAPAGSANAKPDDAEK